MCFCVVAAGRNVPAEKFLYKAHASTLPTSCLFVFQFPLPPGFCAIHFRKWIFREFLKNRMKKQDYILGTSFILKPIWVPFWVDMLGSHFPRLVAGDSSAQLSNNGKHFERSSRYFHSCLASAQWCTEWKHATAIISTLFCLYDLLLVLDPALTTKKCPTRYPLTLPVGWRLKTWTSTSSRWEIVTVDILTKSKNNNTPPWPAQTRGNVAQEK